MVRILPKPKKGCKAKQIAYRTQAYLLEKIEPQGFAGFQR